MDPRFERMAETWCRNCGEGDSVMEYREEIVNSIYDPRSAFDLPVEEEDTIVHSVFRCGSCGAEGDTLEETTTESQNEAYNIWTKHQGQRPIPNPEIPDYEEEDDYEDGE